MCPGTWTTTRTPDAPSACWLSFAEFVRAGLRGPFRKRYPEFSDEEINMMVLAHVTPLDVDFISARAEQLGTDVARHWRKLLRRAREELARTSGHSSK